MKQVFTPRLATILDSEHKFPKLSQEKFRGVSLIALTTLTGAYLFDTQVYDFVQNTPLLGGILILTGLYLEAVMLHLYTNSASLSGLSSKTGGGNYHQTGITYDVAKVIYGQEDDLTGAFLRSTFGTHIYVRSELAPDVVAQWLTSKRQNISSRMLTISDSHATTLIEVVDCILTHDNDFLNFLQAHGVTTETIRGAATLVLSHYYEQKRAGRWWSRDVLSSRGSLGRTLTLGAWRDYVPYTDTIQTVPEVPTDEETYYLNQISHTLQAKRDSNIIITAPDELTSVQLLQKLQHSFDVGTSLGAVNSLSLITINHDAILREHRDTITVEATLRHILTEASQAGNMTLVISDLTKIAAEYLTRGVQFTHVLEDFLTADRIHVVIATTPSEYATLRKEALSLVKRCHEITIEPMTAETMLLLLAHIIFPLEEQARTTVSYGALRAIADTAITYEAPTGETARRLLQTVLDTYRDKTLITTDMALSCLGVTLNLPLGKVDPEERDMLLALEPLLSQTIVGQERAINAIAIALRRMRANLSDTEKPYASFLFLGPSGVGKTETAKTIARVYYGDEDMMIRLDMSEFAESGSVTRLLGSTDETSLLERQLATTPRGLILLDEFEKAHTDVTELFLQILDEGICTTYDGTVLNFRQHIIIATSNAGSDLIARTSDKRALSPVLDSDVIAHIIQKQALSAELIGRFGDIVLFDTLTTEDVQTITEQIIMQLKRKTQDRGFTLSILPSVIDIIVEQAQHKIFGARSIRHLIEHSIEDSIATHIIRGDVKPGDTISITPHDISGIVDR